MTIRSISVVLVFLAVTAGVNAFVTKRPSRLGHRVSTTLCVMGPRQALAMDKRKNPKNFESTIQGLMKQNKLTRAQAEKVRRREASFFIFGATSYLGEDSLRHRARSVFRWVLNNPKAAQDAEILLLFDSFSYIYAALLNTLSIAVF